MALHGTAIRCDCHRTEHLAEISGSGQKITISDRRHGTNHRVALSVQEIVRILDPKGTTFRAVGA